MTSSLSAPAPAAVRSPIGSRRPASASCCSSAAISCPESGTTGTRLPSSYIQNTRRGRPGTARTVGLSIPASTITSAATPNSTAPRCSAWPIAYADFEPYYSEAEQLYHVHGEHGADPTEPPASRPYPHPPVSHELCIQELHDGLRARGYHPFPLPLGILLDEADGKPKRHSACIRCDAFDGYPCPVNGKADAQVICVDPALDHPNVTLLTNAYVRRLDADGSGRTVTKVLVERCGALEEYAADIVVAACGAINSALLLLRSANDRHPHGLANSSGVVGRHYMRHNNSAFLAVSRK